MNTMTALDILALLAIGGGLGLVLALVAVMVYALYHLASTLRRTASRSLAQVAEVLKAQEQTISHLRTDVAQALARVDAERLYQSSLAIQRASKSLGAQTAELQRVLFAQPGRQPALDLGYGMTGGMEPAAEPDDDFTAAPPDPLAGLTPDERERRVQEFFAARNRVRTGQPGSGNQQDIHSVGSVPPAFGSGAYAALAEEAARLQRQHSVPVPAPADFSGSVTEAGDGLDSPEGVDLSDKGELG